MGMHSSKLGANHFFENSPMGQLEELVLGLIIGPSIADSRDAQLRVLDAIGFRSAFAQSPSVGSNNGRVAKVGVDSVKASGIRNSHVHLVAPSHGFRYLHLLLLCRVPVIKSEESEHLII